MLEGTDGTGKTTLGRALSGRGCQVAESPPHPFIAGKQDVLAKAVPLARLAYFMAGNLQLAPTAGQAGTFVAVRYVWSTIAYHAAIEDVAVDDVMGYVDGFVQRLPVPDLTVMLIVDRHEQVSRLRDRSEEGLQADLAESEDFQVTLANAYSRVRELLPWPTITIDTSDRSIDDLTEEIFGRV